MGKSYDCGMIRGISQDPIRIRVKGIDNERDRSGGSHYEGHVVVTKVTGYGAGAHDNKDKEI